VDNPELIQIGAAILGALAFAAVVFTIAWPHLSGDKAREKRMGAVTENRSKKLATRSAAEVAANRKKQVADTLKDIEKRQKAKEKLTLKMRLIRAGIDITPNVFWIASGISGLVFAIACLVMFPAAPIAAPIAGFVGALGAPRWYLSFKTKRRQHKFLADFANSVDVIVRGVKSGLPLNECLNIIARESPDPICTEFQEVVEQQRVGVPLADGLERMMDRMPLPEVKFFAIVIAIQQQAGGNLSEALGNLSGVLRDRTRMQLKVKALSAEAKAGAAVLAALPPIVTLLVYLSSPKYISLLWTTKSGQFFVLVAAIWMTFGILVMKKMINFKY
jgi:tight adherence protein B